MRVPVYHNLPSTEDIMSLYDGYYLTYRPIDLSKKGVSQTVENARKGSETFLRLHTLRDCMLAMVVCGKLDVECGFGRFLLEARSMGADVEGCDLSPEACEFANNKLGIRVHQSELHLCASLMSDFLEHPVEPLLDIQAAVSILKPGGLLLFHTPNGGEAGTNIETARKWVGFRVDLEHFQYLSTHTVNWLSHKYDLRIEQLETSGFPGLKGIDKLPKRKFGTAFSAREMAKKIPMLRGMVKTLRLLKTEMLEGRRGLRLGSYHLFAILRKV